MEPPSLIGQCNGTFPSYFCKEAERAGNESFQSSERISWNLAYAVVHIIRNKKEGGGASERARARACPLSTPLPLKSWERANATRREGLDCPNTRLCSRGISSRLETDFLTHRPSALCLRLLLTPRQKLFGLIIDLQVTSSCWRWCSNCQEWPDSDLSDQLLFWGKMLISSNKI